jgi:hypothetical protein
VATDDEILRAKLRKIESLFAGAGTTGERVAAAAAAERIRARLKETQAREPSVEVRFSISDPWSRQLFSALCRRYGIRPYRYPRMRRQTIIVNAPRGFIDTMLWPEFEQINAALTEYLMAATTRIISSEVFGDSGEAEELAELPAPDKG